LINPAGRIVSPSSASVLSALDDYIASTPAASRTYDSILLRMFIIANLSLLQQRYARV
jgi:hypothetical protein